MRVTLLCLVLAIGVAVVASSDTYQLADQESLLSRDQTPEVEDQLLLEVEGELPQEDQDQPLESRRPRCPRDNSKEVYIPDRNCNKFWQCSNGVAIRMSCPRGLNWNRRLNVCDWPRRARCPGRGRFADADQLDDQDQELLLSQYQIPEVEDQLLLEGGGELPQEDQEQPLESRRPRCPRDNSKEVYIPDRNCNKFWQCSNGVAIRISCPKGLNWNRRLNVCDWPRRARCPGSGRFADADQLDDQDQELLLSQDQILEVEDQLSLEGELPLQDQDQPLESWRPRCPRDNSKEVYIPDRNCNKFWQCSNSVAIRMSCPRGLNWNRRLNVCDWPRRARCSGRGRSADPDQLDVQDQELLEIQDQLAEVQDLLLLENREELPEEDQVQPLESRRPRCPRDNSKEVYIPDRSCNKFWQCSNGVAIRMSCPKGLNWNRRLNVCDWPRRARCPGRGRFADEDQLDDQDQELLLSQDQIPEVENQLSLEGGGELPLQDQDQPLERRPRCPRDNSKEVYIPDRNCNKFWQCSNGVAIRMSCPRGLNWNRRLNVCDWPRRARCTGSGRSADADVQDEELQVIQDQLAEVQDLVLLEVAEKLPKEDQVQSIARLRPRCPRDNSRQVYIPDLNCNRFWQCSNGVAIRMSCPKGTNWNRRLNVCDWPRNARCWWGW